MQIYECKQKIREICQNCRIWILCKTIWYRDA